MCNLCVNNKGPLGPLGEVGHPGPPTLGALLHEWIKNDPILKPHFFLVGYNDGIYFETLCNQDIEEQLKVGYTIAMVPGEHNPDKRVRIHYHGHGEAMGENYKGGKTLGYLRREDPLFMEKLRKLLVEGHDALHKVSNCKIEGEGNQEHIDKYPLQNWWEPGGSL